MLPDTLKYLSTKKYTDGTVFWEIAKNDQCPVDILEEFSSSKDAHLLTSIAENKNAPKHILSKLSKEPNTINTRHAALNNPSIDIDDIQVCIDDPKSPHYLKGIATEAKYKMLGIKKNISESITSIDSSKLEEVLP